MARRADSARPIRGDRSRHGEVAAAPAGNADFAEDLGGAFEDGDARTGPAFGAGDGREKTGGPAARHHKMPRTHGETFNRSRSQS